MLIGQGCFAAVLQPKCKKSQRALALLGYFLLTTLNLEFAFDPFFLSAGAILHGYRLVPSLLQVNTACWTLAGETRRRVHSGSTFNQISLFDQVASMANSPDLPTLQWLSNEYYGQCMDICSIRT